MGAYAASKHASKAFTESLRIELQAADAPISITLIKPSGIATPIGAHAANHLDGEAKIPPPAYDPALVAEAILDCAVHPRREITIGGAGRAQVLFAEHFPTIFERLAPMLGPLLTTRKVAKTQSDNLGSQAQDGAERSAIDPGLHHSIYTAAVLRPVKSFAGLGIILGCGALMLKMRSSLEQRTGSRA